MPGRKSGPPLLSLELALPPPEPSLSAPLEAAPRPAALHTEECANLTRPSSGCSLSSALGALDKALDTARARVQPSTVFQQGLVTPITPTFQLDSPAAAPAPLNDQDSALCKLLLGSDSATTRDPLTMLPPIPPVTTPDSPEDFGFSFEEFEKRYVPLSHLPTPPLSDSISPKSRSSQSEYEALLDTRFLGPAKYLAAMIPPNASSESPSAVILAGILQRANLRPSVVALACCVLDCLSDQFIKRWKMECCNEYGYAERSEVLAVTALAVSMKFLEDSNYTNKLWARAICEELWPVRSLNITERLVLTDLKFCFLNISRPNVTGGHVKEIQRLSGKDERSTRWESDQAKTSISTVKTLMEY